jgi:hypothetical protein
VLVDRCFSEGCVTDLRIIDVSRPAFPVELGALDARSWATDVEVVGDLAYMAGILLRVIDVSNPALPVEVGALVRGSRHPRDRDIEVVGSLAYVADLDFGLSIIDFGPEYAPTIPIDLDIKPGIDLIAGNPASRGVAPVAILGSGSFDVRDVDATTLTFGPAGAAPAHRGGGHFADVNGDGHSDFLSHYRFGETGLVPGDMEACVTGETFDATPFEGCDTVEVFAPPGGLH